MISSDDEHAHPVGTGPHWEESWNFDFVTADGRLAGYARLGLRASPRRAWWWTAIVGTDLPLVLVRDHDVDPPKAGTFEIRGTGLWAEPVCETPLDHWGLGLEAFAVSLDDPAEAYGAERGDPTPLGLDLEWEAAGAPVGLAECRYRVPSRVHGEVLVGRQRLTVAGTGAWEHAWGPRDWWAPAPEPADRPGLRGPNAVTGLRGPNAVTGLRGPNAVTGLEPVFHAPVQVPGPDGRVTRVARTLCRGDGGWQWVERVTPPGTTSAC
ncbi:MAG: hypothetical protein ACRD12_12580 [Acidimicrobiales bacterium]